MHAIKGVRASYDKQPAVVVILFGALILGRIRVRLHNPLSDVRLFHRPDLLDIGWVGRIFEHQVQMVRAHRQQQGDDTAWEGDVRQHATRAPRVELA